MYCIGCGTKISEDSFFCQECGINLHTDLTESEVRENLFHNIEIPPLLRSNSYHVLGIDTSCHLQEVRKRGKEIISHLKIENLQEYDLDIENPHIFRNVQSVKSSLQKLSSPKTCMKEFFFWFYLPDIQFKKDVVSAFKENNPENCFEKLRRNSDYADETNNISKKNMALFVSILLCQRKFKSYLSFSLDLWKSIIDSEKFWEQFVKSYTIITHYDMSNESICDFKNTVLPALSDLYTEIGQITNDPEYILEFQKKFGIKGKKITHNFLEPIFLSIDNSIEEFASTNSSNDFLSDKIIENRIDSFLSKIKYEFYRLEILGLYDDSQSISFRNQTAENIRTVSIRLFKQGYNAKKPLKLIKFARNIAATSELCMLLDDDLRYLDKIID